MLPGDAYHSVARAVVTFLGDAVMDLLRDDAIPAYNMYALVQLSRDVARLRAFAEVSDVPNMVVRFCHLSTAFEDLHLPGNSLNRDMARLEALLGRFM
jgi:hypothetical protein